MTELHQVYRCEKCGNIVQVNHAAGGELACCGQPMNIQIEGAVDAAVEKHVPYLEKIDGGFKISVGATIHPMTEDHYIEWIELLGDGKSCRKFFKPGDEPVVQFMVKADKIIGRGYCNLHGFWKAEL